MNECKRNILPAEEKPLNLNSLSYLTNVFLCLLLSSLFISRKTRSTHWQLIKKQNPIMSVFFFFAQNWKLQQFECLLWQQQIPSAVRPPGGKEEHLSTCCFAAEAHLAAWLTLDVPLDLASVLQAQSLVQLLQDHLQLLDLSHGGQGDLVHRQVDARKPGCKQQQQQKKRHHEGQMTSWSAA